MSLASLKRAKAILFDMDGVLFMSNDLHARAYNLAFENEGIFDFDHTEISGMRTDEVVYMVLRRNGRPASVEDVARVTAEKRRLAKIYFANDLPVLPGCFDLLQSLESNYPLALATSASLDTANRFLDGTNVRQFFSFIISGTEVTSSKPHPEIYQRAISAMNQRPEDCIVVEDSIFGVQSGIGAGATVIGVHGTFDEKQLSEAGATLVIPDANHLIPILT